MTRATHDLVNDHFGELADAQIASGSPASGDVPISDGAGGRTWGPQSGSGGGGAEDMLTDPDDVLFESGIGNWISSSGTTSYDTGNKFAVLNGSLEWASPTTNNDYVEVAVPGTFEAGIEYHAVIAWMIEEAESVTADLILGVPGTDSAVSNLFAFGNGSLGVASALWSLAIVRWVPTADRTGVKLRLVRTNATGTETFHVGYARVVRPNNTLGLTQFTDSRLIGSELPYSTMFMPVGNSSVASLYTGGLSSPNFRVTGGGISISGGNGEEAWVGVARDGLLFMSGGGTVASDLSQEGINFEFAPDYVGFFISQKSGASGPIDGTIQFYADYGDYNFEFVDGAAGRWQFRSDIDGYATPSMGMLPQYASAPHVGTETEGESYYDTTLHKNRTWDGSAWQNWW